MYVPDDGSGGQAELLNPTQMAVVKDEPIDEGGLESGKNCLFKTGVQAYLQQLYGLKMVNRLRVDHEKKNNTTYQWVLRVRLDVLFLNPIPDLDWLDDRYIHVPDFHRFDGINDRFALGSAANMDVYMNKFDDIHGYIKKWRETSPLSRPVSAEMFTAGHLRSHGISMKNIPIRFNRVREYGVKNDTTRLAV
jgi:hypothetical protein